MSQFLVDMHIHSRYSMATSKALGPRQLAAWGAMKGLQVVATADFTHPGWLQEIEDSLQEDGNGLLSLREPADLDREIPWIEDGVELTPPRFLLGTEISSIYKRQGALRKIHNLVFFPSLDSVRRFNQRLERIGNLRADGRPILGLDSRDLLEIVLETDPYGFLIPAHIWTPWFSLFGSKSGFDSIYECFGPLSQEIFALETGLSSDPEMNWLWSELDQYRLVSNSDAHSGEKLAREANLFQGEVSYYNLLESLKHPERNPNFLGTVEFFPEEGKYHLDGHRNCGVRLDPRETFRLGNICPACGKQLTVGVLNRVCRLADREQPTQPTGSPSYHCLIPLPEVLSEILGVGSKSKKVRRLYQRLVKSYDSELDVLMHTPTAELRKISLPLAEALRRMRSGQVHREPGYDGEFGVISAFSPQERRELHRGRGLVRGGATTSHTSSPSRSPIQESDNSAESEDPTQEQKAFNEQQKKAIEESEHPLLVLAGPGTGKTRTLIGRARRLCQLGYGPENVLILTFTRAAAREVRERLTRNSSEGTIPRVDTLHSLAYQELCSKRGGSLNLMPEEDARRLFGSANPQISSSEAKVGWESLALSRETLRLQDDPQPLAENYRREKNSRGLLDYTDLLEMWLEQSRDAQPIAYQHVLVDEVQDLSPLQLKMISRLVAGSGKGLFAIGDPEQSIYGFRGAVHNVEKELTSYWPQLQTVHLHENYRSGQSILDFSAGLKPGSPRLVSRCGTKDVIRFYRAQTSKQEAVWIAEQIKSLLGGMSHLQADQRDSGGLSPGDIAVLVRLRAMLPVIRTVLDSYGLPCSSPEEENFWEDTRIRFLLNTVAAKLGHPVSDSDIGDCPEEALHQGPRELASALREQAQLDSMFWQSRPFRELERSYRENGSWRKLLDWIALERELSQIESRGQKIRLMTMHAAKGLELDAVFLAGLEEGILPLTEVGKTRDEEGMEEERRLLYVGLTRPKTVLHLSRAERRQLYGNTRSRPPSRFLRDLPWEGVEILRGVKRAVPREKRMRLI